jgi:hypothetical protein
MTASGVDALIDHLHPKAQVRAQGDLIGRSDK